MAYDLHTGDIIGVQVVGQLHGQTTRTTFHYHLVLTAPVSDGADELGDFLDQFDLAVGSKMRARASEEWSHVRSTAQVLGPVRRRLVVDGINQNGEQAGSSCPSGVCIVIRRWGERAGRKYQGRIYLPGVPVAFETDSTVTPGERGNFDDLVDAVKTVITTSGGTVQWVPTLDRTHPGDTDQWVLDSVLDVNLRYQRRREIGVGE